MGDVSAYLRRNHLALVALFFAMSGSAVALQEKNTVGSRDIKPRSVERSDIAPESVTSAKVGR